MNHAPARVLAACLLALLALLSLLSSCAGLPAIRPVPAGPERDSLRGRCEAAFARRAFRAVHVIEASLPMGNESSLVGVTLADPSRLRFRSVLLSVEGLTLFDATSTPEGFVVHRAVPPLDDEGFGRGLVSDVALALLPPSGEIVQAGRLEDGSPICRYRDAGTRVMDVIFPREGSPRILCHYDASGRLQRRVEFDPAGGIVLTAPGAVGYTLRLRLIQTEEVTPDEDLFRP